MSNNHDNRALANDDWRVDVARVLGGLAFVRVCYPTDPRAILVVSVAAICWSWTTIPLHAA
jgi:hypothetical protein